MIVLNRRDGSSIATPSADEFEPTSDWTGLLLKAFVDVSVASPRGMGLSSISVDPYYEGEVHVGDRIAIQTDHVGLDILVYRNQNRVRVAMRRTGRTIWSPGR